MMRRVLINCLLLLLVNLGSSGKENPSTGFVFLPEGHLFAPLRANIEEPRIGVLKFLDAAEMKVDIGNAIDVFGLNYETFKLTAGIDFMAYAFTTGAQGLRLQIDALDGFFGGDLSGILFLSKEEQLQIRMRILHLSAHMVDGHYLPASNSWIDNRAPIPFTRDFGELTIAHVLTPSFGILRYYGGLSYATLVRPAAIRRFAFLAGYEIVCDRLFGTVADKPTNIYFAHHIGVMGIPAYTTTNTIQAGVKFGRWFERGPSFYIEYYAGMHMFSEYFNERLRTIGLGFTVDFF
jgi:hypothetical protein